MFTLFFSFSFFLLLINFIMTEDQMYTSFRNEQTSTNLCASQDIIFDLEKYGLYLDKIRAFFVPSLEYRVHSLLEEFMYSTNSRWAKQFPYFKKFINAIVTWKDPLNGAIKYDIDTVEEMMKNIIKRMIKDDLITCFLDSVILHHRLTKVCHKLDAMNIEDNILKSLNTWIFVNKRDYLLNQNCFMNFNTTMDCKMNLNTIFCNAEESIKYKKADKLLAKNIYDRNIEHTRSIMSEYQECQGILDLNRNFIQQREDNSNHYSTYVITGSQNSSTNKINRPFNKKSCNTESKKIRNSLKMKIIVHTVYLKDNEYSTFSNSTVTCLSLPCKPSNLINRIFEADPSLTESCLIVMKKKFEDSMYNVCSCLNDSLEKLNVKLQKISIALCLNCEIYPGYISFKLKTSNIKKCLFVARVPICQNVHKYTIQQDFSILSSSSNSGAESKNFEQYKDVNSNFNDTLGHIDEESKEINPYCSRSHRSFKKDISIDMSQNKTENVNKKRITCMTELTENVSSCVPNLTIFSCKDIVEKIACLDNSEERNKESCKVLNSREFNNDDNVENCREKILELNNSVTMNDTELVNANCMCLSCENFIKTNNKIEDIFSNKDLDNFSHITGINECDWTYSSNKKLNLQNGVFNINTCSITSFVQNSEYDKQLIELNCNRFSNNNINAIDKRFSTQENKSSLNLAKVETECNSYCSCRCDNIIDITLFNDISKDNIVCAFETPQDNFNALKVQNTDYSKTQMSSRNNNLLTISVQMPKSKTLSKGIIKRNVNACPRTARLTFNDNKNISTVVKESNRYNELTNFSTHASIVSRKGNKILPVKEAIFNGTQDFITPSGRFFASKEKFRSNKDSRSSDILTREYLRAENYSTYVATNASLHRRSFTTTKFASDRRDEFQKFNKSKTLSKLREHGCVRSQNGIHNSTTIKNKTMFDRYSSDYPTETQSQTRLTIKKFRNSVDKIKRLIRAKLGRILFNSKTDNNNEMIKTFWRSKEFFNDRRKKSKNLQKRQSHGITSYSTCNCYRRSYTTFSRESSNVILTICKTKKKRKNKEKIKFCDHRLANDNKALLSFHSIKAPLWSYDFSTSTTKDIEKHKLNRNNRLQYNRQKKIGNVINCGRNSHQWNLKNSSISITISSQSTELSEDNKCICKQMHNQNQHENKHEKQECAQYRNKNKYQDILIECSIVNSNKSSKTSLSHTRDAKNGYKQFYDIPNLRNVKKFASSKKKNRQVFKKDMFDRFDDSLRERLHIFTILTDACNDYIDDLDLDFKLKLLRYINLCKSIKHLLMKTLRPDGIYEISTTSVSDSDL
ncbi:uncharacterized protein LOC105838629 [Monomorium pharaonis]|uniref:uncharacterized protein LOC105838629 n=1 Tax=Monomorium pharaonis TaxID=307658 RepID=UPI0017461842|nr:uncharacterized protein LOC105838629 [Monomorium pharaonis]